MQDRIRVQPKSTVSGLLLGLALVAVPVGVAAEPRAKLVHCGNDTCLRITGSRSDPAVAVRIAGRVIPVEGSKSWRVTLPLSATRGGVDTSGQMLMLTLTDPRTGIEQVQAAILPPGALGKPVELASLVVYAH